MIWKVLTVIAILGVIALASMLYGGSTADYVTDTYNEVTMTDEEREEIEAIRSDIEEYIRESLEEDSRILGGS